MAQFNMGSLGNIENLNDFKKVQSYLYKLAESLQYLFNNLDPDENYSSVAAEQYKTLNEVVTELDTAVANLMVKVANLEKRINSMGG